MLKRLSSLRLILPTLFICLSSQLVASGPEADKAVCEYIETSSHLVKSENLIGQCSEYGRIEVLDIPASACGATDQPNECLWELTELKGLFIESKAKAINPSVLAQISDELMTMDAVGRQLCRARQELYMTAPMWNTTVAGELYNTCISDLQDFILKALDTADWVAN